jgi:hypothetical protein
MALEVFLNERPLKYRCKEYAISSGSVLLFDVSYLINNE